MAKILSKAFDATKRIIMSKFLGSPNLFTTSDVNRQVEAFKYQLDQLDDKVGVLSDISWNVENLGSRNYRLTPTFTYIKVKGCDFSSLLNNNPFEVELQAADTPFYICLFGETEEVTYADDAGHTVAGASFEDGTSRPAANQIRYKASTVRFGTSSSPTTETDLIAILLTMQYNSGFSDAEVILKKNTVAEGESLLLKGSEQLEYITTITSSLSVGDSFTRAINKLATQINRLFDRFRTSNSLGVASHPHLYLRNGTTYTENQNVSIGINNGFLVVKVTEGSYNFRGNLTDFVDSESGRTIDLGCVRDANILAALETYNTLAGSSIDFGICGHTYRPAYGEDATGSWSVLKLVLKKRNPVYYSQNPNQEWDIQLEMEDLINPAPVYESSDLVGVKLEHDGYYWPEANAPFSVTKEINIFPLLAFLGN